MQIRYPTGNITAWRMREKARLIDERGWTCERPGCNNRIEDLDEAIVTRKNMMGLSLEQKRIAYCTINLELVCARHNREGAQDREGAWQRAVERYGLETCQQWYASIGFKSPEKRFMP